MKVLTRSSGFVVEKDSDENGKDKTNVKLRPLRRGLGKLLRGAQEHDDELAHGLIFGRICYRN